MLMVSENEIRCWGPKPREHARYWNQEKNAGLVFTARVKIRQNVVKVHCMQWTSTNAEGRV